MSPPGSRGPGAAVGASARPNERTRLAWQRTVLAGTVGCLLVARVLALAWWPGGVLLAGVAGVVGLLLFYLSARQYRRHQVDLQAGRPVGDGRRLVLLVVLLGLGALGAGGFLVATWP